MIKHKYGEFTEQQFIQEVENIRKQIFFLLLCADKDTKDEFQGVNLNKAFVGLLYKLNGLNSILNYPKELVEVISLLEKARKIYKRSLYNKYFDFLGYRKCILDAGNLIIKLDNNVDKEVPE